MKKLHLIDDTFLRLESRNQPLHVGVLMLLDLPPGAPEDFAGRIVQKLRRADSAADVFNQLLVEKRGKHYWQENDDFDLDHHFVHLALPKPGRIRELLQMVSRLHCGHLDRAYPLWRVYLIEGIEDDRIAIYMKIHHALVDGMSGMQLVIKSMATSRAESKKMPAFWEVQRSSNKPAKIPAVPAPAVNDWMKIGSVARKGWRSAMPVIGKLRKAFKDFQKKNPDVALAGEAPKCVFNQQISGTRRFAAQSYATKRIKGVSSALDATSNDVILGMVAGALRKYLEVRGELPDMSLTAGVPVSVRSKNARSDAANQVAFVITNLATDIDDPVERLRAIKSSMDYNKAQLRGLSAGQVQAYSSLSVIPGALNVLLGRKPGNTLGNVVVSHVPGPKKTLYWQGAKLTGIYPISLVIATGGLNITIVSRHDNVDFGIIACRKTVLHVQRLLDYLEDALSELESLVSRSRPARKKTATKKTGSARTKPAASGKRPAAKTKAAPRKRARTNAVVT